MTYQQAIKTDARERDDALWILLGILLVVRLFMAWAFPMTDTTEARYADMARMMVETGDWITPRFNYDVPFWGKPPLHTWLSALGIAVFEPALTLIGLDTPRDLAVRLPILGSAIALLWILQKWITAQRDHETALIAVIILASSGLFFGASAFVMTDMPLALGVCMAMAGFHMGMCRDDTREGRSWAFMGFAGLTVGLLAKGPIVLPLVGLPFVLWVVSGRRWHLAARLPWMSGLLLVLATTLPWYIAAELKTPGFLQYFIVGEHFERFVVPGWEGDLYGSGHERAKGIVWLYWLVVFLPWTLFAAALLLPTRSKRPVRNDNSLRIYLLLFALSPLIVFTPAANLLAAYVLPGLAPAAALLAITWYDRNLPRGRIIGTLFAAASLAFPMAFLLAFLLGNDRTWPLRTASGAIWHLERVAPEAHLHMLGRRFFSAEYYSDGQATVVAEVDMHALLTNGQRDAVIVLDKTGDRPVAQGFRDLGTWTVYRLWLENAPG